MSDQITHRQSRCARAMLGWSMVDLAKAAGLSVSTVKRAEEGAPEGVSSAALDAIRVALEAAGISFTPDEGDGEGVRIRAKAGTVTRDG